MKITKKHEPLSSAKAIIGLLALAIIFVLFSKFITNQDLLMTDPEALRNYVMFTIVVAGFLVGLLYLASKTTHKVKAVKSKKKKK